MYYDQPRPVTEEGWQTDVRTLSFPSHSLADEVLTD